MAVVGTKEILGQEYDIDVSKYGVFYIKDVAGEDGRSDILGSGDTLDQATAKARIELNKRKVKVQVPFITKNGQRGMATALHGRNRKVLTTLADGAKQAVDQHTRVFKPDMPKEVLDSYLDKVQRERELTAEIRKIDKEWEFSLGQTVIAAINEAAAAKAKPLARIKS